MYKTIGVPKNLDAYKNLVAYKNLEAWKNIGAYRNIGACEKTRRPPMLAQQEKLGARQCWRSRKSRRIR
jgi:hypothetical protein